eukprot:COSAG05_NODE_3241_length_2214_cov_3.910165_2_plen_135_part_01
MKQQFCRKRNKAGIRRYRKWVQKLSDEATEADRCGNVKRVYQIARILGRKGKGRSSNAQPELDAMRYVDGICNFDKSATRELAGASDRAEYFAKFGRHKFKSLTGTMSDLPDLPGSVQSRRHDIPSDEELEVCLA